MIRYGEISMRCLARDAIVGHISHVKRFKVRIFELFILMSGRKRRDYEAVLRTLMKLLPQRPNVCQVVSDFEDALWKATSNVLAGVTHHGCSFYWAQAVWHRLQGLGFQTAYTQQEAVYRYCRKLLALPFLPASSIITVFEQMEAKAKTPLLQSLMDTSELSG